MRSIVLFDLVAFLKFLPVFCLNSFLLTPIDLSHALSEETPFWNSSVKFRLVNRINISRNDGSFYAANDFIGAEHGGTHLDAPYHFYSKGVKVDEIPLSHLLSTGILIDVSSKVTDADFELLPIHLEEWVRNYGPIPQDTIVLIKFGWSSRYPDRLKYFGAQDYPYHFPGISPAGAKWLANSGKIVGVGVDTPSLDAGKSSVLSTHMILTKASIFGLENVALHGANLPVKGFNLIVLPLKIKGGSGGPCRIVAV